jgi:hypothetical protein
VVSEAEPWPVTVMANVPVLAGVLVQSKTQSMSHSLALVGTVNWANEAGPVPVFTWEMEKGIVAVVVNGGRDVDELVGAVVLEPDDALVVDVVPVPELFGLLQALKRRPAATRASSTEPEVRRSLRT